MQYYPAGAITNVLWYEIKNHATNVELGEFVVMPNHVHGIVIINKNDKNDPVVVGTTHALSLQQQKPHALHLQSPQTIGQTRFQNQGKNTLSYIIGGYKSAVTKHCNRLGLSFGWQSRFY